MSQVSCHRKKDLFFFGPKKKKKKNCLKQGSSSDRVFSTVVLGGMTCHPRFLGWFLGGIYATQDFLLFFFEYCMTCDPTMESTWLAELLELPAAIQQTSSPSQLPSRAVQPPPPSQAKVNRAKVAYRAPAALLLSDRQNHIAKIVNSAIFSALPPLSFL